MTARVRNALLGAALIAPLALPSSAAQAPVHVRGTLSAVSATSITIATGKGPVVVALTPKTGFAGALPGTDADIKPGTFIGTANVATSGPARALEVTVFPDSMRGAGEGDYPWDMSSGAMHSAMTNGTVSPAHGSMMTNATVSHMSGGAAKTITVTYKGGTKTIAIPPNAPVVVLSPGTAKLLVPGARVFAIAPSKDGKLFAAFVVVGEKGTVPPM
jgi:hypothetical protein